MGKVQDILSLLGADERRGRTPVLVPIPAKQKGPTAPGWNEVTWERMGDEDYLEALEAHPNTGVILGGASGALATIDIDVEEFVLPFLQANPRLARSLRTKGSKGCQIWIWLKPDEKLTSLGLPAWIRGYPDRRMNIVHRVLTTETEDKDGATKKKPLVWGEWRSGGVQSVIRGIHPNGNEYKVVVPGPPVEISFRDIIWPEWSARPWEKDLFDAVIGTHGEPFSAAGGGLEMCQHFWAARYALMHDVLYEPGEERFYAYDSTTGAWGPRTGPQVMADVSRDLLNVGRGDVFADPNSQQAIYLRTNMGRSTAAVSSVVRYLEGEVSKPNIFEREPGVIHLQNGMLDVRGETPFLDAFSPNYFSRNQVKHAYAPGSKCPLWTETLLAGALEPDDIDLLQKVAGMCLLGSNILQRIVILTGTAGAGKSQIAQVIQGIIGRHNVAQLRTEHLEERFEAEGFIGKTLLVGSDVPGSFLNRSSASQLKSLTGGDYLQAEIKGGRRVDIAGKFNVLITCNSRLVVKTDEDSGAWRRRLVILHFGKPPPAVKIPNLADRILAEEASGVLDWMIVGAQRVLAESKEHGALQVTDEQRERVQALLNESESVRHFVETGVEEVEKEFRVDVTNEELLEAYRDFCAERGWNALPDATFYNQLRDLMLRVHQRTTSNDIKRTMGDRETVKRGYRHVRAKGLVEA